MTGALPEADFDWLEAPSLRAVMDALGAAGEARFVGGCVRDSLLGRPPSPMGGAGTTDIDVATTLTPEETTAALTSAGLAAHPTGIEHGTVTAVSGGLPVEVTTLRADVATDGRHAEVAFTRDWDQDWRRRDFRLNALYLGADGQLFDPAGGLEDLRARRVRFIGDADTRIAEDYLRILRFFRFTARYAEAPDEEGLAACARGADGLRRLSKERIWQETAKLFAAPRAPEAFEAMAKTGILARVLEAPAETDAFAALHRLLHADVPPALGIEALWPTAPREALQRAFKPATAVLDRIEVAREAGADLTLDQNAGLARQLYRFGAEAVTDASLLEAARTGETAWLDHANLAATVPVPILPIQGRDLIARGLEPGLALGRTLKAIEAAWLSAGCPEDEETIEEIVEEVLG
ncbi:CCA tRNA nucleotidyltransferase [Parvularcula dongshanensis]|uniref:Poly(A) polymerase n=1 Tax=Parvularcula dongshanensis TaxID=1173995 RepID=A0A840I0Y0_9PROT|nr:CCA tRNA nucleotidyltransferase [Parvularcula dongshanensis]MBB4657862.1 poly(A) polymerase [Parvularcula dongshanensis]